jgi:signal transduction histidine kinase
MNKRFIERTGYDATGELCYSAIHGLDSICSWCVNERVFKGETVRWEVQSPKDGRWLYVVNTPIYHEDGTISKQAMILDITDRKEMEEALKKSSEKIKQFAYSVSHDLKSPAIGIHGLTKRLYKQYANTLEAKGKEYCDKILKGAEQISSLVEQINVYISTKEAPLAVERVKLKEIVQSTREEFARQLRKRHIDWAETDPIPELNADKLSLLRLLRNLVDNALKHGGDDLSQIRIGFKESDDFHIISVEDDGVGLEEDDAKRLFGPFTREEASKGVEGAGLGLSIVKEIAEQHGGEVLVQSERRKGTTFYVSISKHLK